MHLSKVVKSRPRTPVENAAELIEYLHAVGNLDHLKPKGLELPFYKLYMLDVYLVIVVVIALALVLFLFLVKNIVWFCESSKKMKHS